MEPQYSEYQFGSLKVTLTTQGHTLSDILEAFEYVLKGQGYSWKGGLDFVYNGPDEE